MDNRIPVNVYYEFVRHGGSSYISIKTLCESADEMIKEFRAAGEFTQAKGIEQFIASVHEVFAKSGM